MRTVRIVGGGALDAPAVKLCVLGVVPKNQHSERVVVGADPYIEIGGHSAAHIQICISIFHKSNPLYLCIPMKFSGKNRIFVENWYRLRYTETNEFGIVSKMSPLILFVIFQKEVPI